ncbi:MAG: hypothetical protein WAW96_09195 [Alphaproteobacteria bacterium]
MTANGYVLRVPADRRTTLQEGLELSDHVGEPVPRFDHPRGSPILVLLSFDDHQITHVADGRKGKSGGTGLVVLWLTAVEELRSPVSFAHLVATAPSKVRRPLHARLQSGGLLAPKSLGATVDALIELEPSIRERIARYSARRIDTIRALPERARENLAIQKEQLNVALRMAGLDHEAVALWSPPESGEVHSFLEGIKGPVGERTMIIGDADIVPGFKLDGKDARNATKTFVRGTTRLSVTIASDQPLEQQTGADLIYFNQTYGSFVMVQYKTMRQAKWQGADTHLYRPNSDKNLPEEIKRMDALNAVLGTISPCGTLAGYRLNADPFYFKLCKRSDFDPDNTGLFGGMYLPLEYWKVLVKDPRTKGPRGGRAVGFENVGRKLSNSEFVQLVASGYIGSRVYQTSFINALIEQVLKEGKAITLAVRDVVELEGDTPPASDDGDDDDEDGDQDI